VILVILAHPYPSRSRACAALVEAVRNMRDLEVRSLYDLYPDFDVDRVAEQSALERARLVVWLHPLFWYTVPALMKHWMDHVLVRGFAFGPEGGKLAGKDLLWAPTTGGDDAAFSAAGRHNHAFSAFTPGIEQSARFCGMNWLEPFVLHGAHEISDEALRDAGLRLRARLGAWQEEAGARGA
jgi:glutathione-regulated potassium-efflux system ancillary protein KefF